MPDHSTPACPHCNYSLVGLPEPRCPECGAEIPPEYLQNPAIPHLLPWERSHLRGWLPTVAFAIFRPGRFAEQLDKRKLQPIHSPLRYVALIAFASLAVHMVTDVARTLIAMSGDWERFIQTYTITWSATLMLAMVHVLTILMTAWLLAGLLLRPRKPELGKFGWRDLGMALSAPTLSGAVLFQVMHLAPKGYMGEFVAIAMLSQPILLGITFWFVARQTRIATTSQTVALLILMPLLMWIASMAVSRILTPLFMTA